MTQYSEDLLRQAELLLRHDKRRPKQASLRRGISTCYYSLFHGLIGETSRHLFGSLVDSQGSGMVIPRLYDHTQMKQACLRFSRAANNQPPELLRAGWAGLGIARITRLQSLAGCFVELQEARHRADYDLAASFTRPEAMAWIQRVRDAFADWAAVKNSHPDAASLFALTLLTWGQISRRS